jgi:acyl carrier protein
MATFDRNDTAAKVKALIAQELKVDPASVAETSTFKDLGADSLDMVQIVMKFEEQFGLEIKDEDAEHMNNVADVVNYIHGKRTK